MKKGILAITAVLVLTISGVALAQIDKGMMGDKGMGMMGGDMMGKGMMGGKMMGMCPMKSMMERSVVATSDGGVVIVMGTKITKYDKNLNLVKETEIKMDMAGMQKNMMDMMKDCPMMGKGMTAGSESKGEASSTEATSDNVDHQSHH